MRVDIVVPCYNEEEVLPIASREIGAYLESLIKLNEVDAASKIIFVDDGSQDQTWEVILSICSKSNLYSGLKLSRNRGHQNALLSGLLSSHADAVISMDADLQDDITAMREMIKLAKSGAEVVYGVRKSRSTDTSFKRKTAEIYYKLLSLAGVEIVFNHADYRLLKRKALDALKQYEESNLFLRGIIPQLGFSTAVVYYDRSHRAAGVSKYPLRKMLSFAWLGITSFSIIPLRFIAYFGAVIALLSLIIALWALLSALVTNQVVPGWASTVVPLYLLGGIHMLFLGVLGEYVGKIYLEVKRRPRFLVDEKINI